MLVALLGRARAIGIDGDQPRAAPAGLLDEGPQVHVGADDVGAPGHDQPRLHDGLGVEADAAAHRGLVAGRAGRGADGAVEQAGAQQLEEAPVHGAVREKAHVARVRVGQDRLGPVALAGAAQAGRHQVEGLVPRDALEAPPALAPHALLRVQQALGAVDALQVAVDLGAQEALGEAVLRVAAQLDRAAVLDRHRHHARVGAVVGADDLQRATAGGGSVERHPTMLREGPGPGEGCRAQRRRSPKALSSCSATTSAARRWAATFQCGSPPKSQGHSGWRARPRASGPSSPP